MSLLSKLAGLPTSLKEAWRKTFGDDAVVALEEPEIAGAVVAHPTLTVEQAYGLLGLSREATLDQVRMAARTRGRELLRRVHAHDAEAQRVLENVVAASERVEEHLLPALRGSTPASAAFSTAPSAPHTAEQSTQQQPSSSSTASGLAAAAAGPTASFGPFVHEVPGAEPAAGGGRPTGGPSVTGPATAKPGRRRATPRSP